MLHSEAAPTRPITDGPVGPTGTHEPEATGPIAVEHLTRWITILAADDPVFARASALRPAADRAWQSAVYLLTADGDLWSHFGPAVVRDRSLDAVVVEALALYGLDRMRMPAVRRAPERWWRPVQTDLLVWASFCWTDRWFDGPGAVPRSLSSVLHERWLSALWIHKDHVVRAGLLG